MAANNEKDLLNEIDQGDEENHEMIEMVNQLTRSKDRINESDDLLIDGKISSAEMIKLIREEQVITNELNRRMQEHNKP
ncbi:MAG: hypothetical protein WCW53_09400 [Syntrophales bacterium]